MEDFFQFSIGVILAAADLRLLNLLGEIETDLLVVIVIPLFDYDWHCIDGLKEFRIDVEHVPLWGLTRKSIKELHV